MKLSNVYGEDIFKKVFFIEEYNSFAKIDYINTEYGDCETTTTIIKQYKIEYDSLMALPKGYKEYTNQHIHEIKLLNLYIKNIDKLDNLKEIAHYYSTIEKANLIEKFKENGYQIIEINYI